MNQPAQTKTVLFYLLMAAMAGGTIVNANPSVSVYGSDFEAGSGYSVGSLDSQDGWSVLSGSATVWTGVVYSGTQSAQIAPGGSATHQLPTSASSVSFTTYMQAVSSTTPAIPATANAALLYIDVTNGITGLDGDGIGNGIWVGSGISPTAGAWFRLDLSLDFSSKTWSCAVNGTTVLSGLHFQSTNITSMGTLTVNAPGKGQTLLDATSVSAVYNAPYPSLSIIQQGNTVNLSWPSAFSGFTLQSASTLNNPVWTNVPSFNNRATNTIGGTSSLYRLIGNY